MPKRPIKGKTSSSKNPARNRGAKPRRRLEISRKRDWLSPEELGELQGCSGRTIREWCHQGVIEEAYQTQGSHWRIRMPLSMKTRYQLEKRRDDWPLDNNTKSLQGLFNPVLAECLLLAQLYQRDIDEDLPVPTLAELGDPVWKNAIDHSNDPKAAIAVTIQSEILNRMRDKEPLCDLLLIGWVYQFWHKDQGRPTVAEIAKLMGLSRGGFYRRYTSADLDEAYFVVSGESKRVLPDIDGLNAVERANRAAKKSNFKKLEGDYQG